MVGRVGASRPASRAIDQCGRVCSSVLSYAESYAEEGTVTHQFSHGATVWHRMAIMCSHAVGRAIGNACSRNARRAAVRWGEAFLSGGSHRLQSVCNDQCAEALVWWLDVMLRLALAAAWALNWQFHLRLDS